MEYGWNFLNVNKLLSGLNAATVQNLVDKREKKDRRRRQANNGPLNFVYQ